MNELDQPFKEFRNLTISDDELLSNESDKLKLAGLAPEVDPHVQPAKIFVQQPNLTILH